MILKNLLGAAAIAGLALFPAVASAESSETYKRLNLFGEVFEKILESYVEKPEQAALIEAAVSGMLRSLDPHSSYMSEKAYGNFREHMQGEFGGLGIEVTMENGLVKVVTPIDDTPAARAGVKTNDLISHLDGEPILGLTLGEAVEKMRGPIGSAINITVRREGVEEPFDIKIVRDVIRIKSVRHDWKDDIAYIRITTFNEKTSPGLVDAMEKAEQEIGERLKGYVLDLRNNPGGSLTEAVAVSDAFLDKGEIVTIRGRLENDNRRYTAESDSEFSGDLAEGKPVIVIINGGSASASEIVAGALQDHRRAIILGTKSFGKGSVQTIFPLDATKGGSAIRLTTARYYTPKGRSIQAKGIEPDIEVEQIRDGEQGPAQRRSERDLRGHLKNEDGEDSKRGADDKTSEATPRRAPQNDAEREDYQLAYALNLLRGINLIDNAGGKASN